MALRMSRSERMPTSFVPFSETTSEPIPSARRRRSASATDTSGRMVFTSRPLRARMYSTFIRRSSPLHRMRAEARVAQAPPLDRIGQDRSGRAALELGQLTLGPDRIGHRSHLAVPAPGLDARGLEDQIAP